MRWAKSYSIVDHELLHGGYLQRLSHEALTLYLFLVVVGDRDGKSYYADLTTQEILRMKGECFAGARRELVEAQLILFRSPYYWVKSLKSVEPTRPRAEDGKQRDEQRLKVLLKQLDLLSEGA